VSGHFEEKANGGAHEKTRAGAREPVGKNSNKRKDSYGTEFLGAVLPDRGKTARGRKTDRLKADRRKKAKWEEVGNPRAGRRGGDASRQGKKRKRHRESRKNARNLKETLSQQKRGRKEKEIESRRLETRRTVGLGGGKRCRKKDNREPAKLKKSD